MPSSWRTFDQCGATERWRYLDDGHIEIESRGVPTRPFPQSMDQWREQIDAASIRWAVPRAWIAAIVMHESGGKQRACFPSDSSPDGCNHGDGFGLMALLTTTASSLAERPVSADELRDDPALNIDLGTKYLRRGLDKSREHFGTDDIVWAGVAYNAGSVKCWSKPCPQDGYGVLYGCITDRDGNRISTRYPENLIASVNVAIENGYDGMAPESIEPGGDSPEPAGDASFLGTLALMIGTAAIGYVVVRHVRLTPQLRLV